MSRLPMESWHEVQGFSLWRRVWNLDHALGSVVAVRAAVR